MARILFIEPYYGGSHRAFADGLREHSSHAIELLTLPEGEWRSRMRRGAIELARLSDALPGNFDAIIATDMLDLGQFLGLTRPRFANVPVMYYLHENQFTYPRLKGTKLNSWFGQVNYMSSLVADVVAFNSSFHRSDFLGALRSLSGQPTNWLDVATLESIARKAIVVPIGLDLQRFDQHQTPLASPPVILWNHRWEFDKAPAMFARAITVLANKGVPFDLALAGEPGPNPHPSLLALREDLDDRLVQFGRVEDAADYARLLWRSKVAVSTSRHEFFGISTVEAMYAGCFPIAPRALNYPDLVPANRHRECLYTDEPGLLRLLEQAVTSELECPELRASAARWDWSRVGPEWDAAIAGLINS